MKTSQHNAAERILKLSQHGSEVVPALLNRSKGGFPNVVKTTKFTWLTWLPKSLWWQFQRVANVYFLFVAVIVCFDFSPKGWASKVFPFAGVLLWTALKDLYEDFRRKQEDDKENGRKCLRFNVQRRAFEKVAWREVLVGDLLFVPNDEPFAADLCLLQAAGGHEAFMSTVNLDGETNLKERRAPQLVDKRLHKLLGQEASHGTRSFLNHARSGMSFTNDALASEIADAARVIHALLQQGVQTKMAAPEIGLADVRGTLEINGEVASLSEKNFLPRGCVLRNTVWIVALVVYAGDETKTRLNAVASTQKVSNLQRYLNMAVRGLLVVLFLMCGVFATLAVTIHDDEDGWFIKFLTYCITLYHVVPISLYVCFEMLKLGLGYRLNIDPQMVDPETNQGAMARTADLMEELGQVDFLFSDKTGTLTANEMVFAHCYIAEAGDFGDFRASGGEAGLKMAKSILAIDSGDKRRSTVTRFFTCLAACHAVQAEVVSTEHETKGKRYEAGDIMYSGMSPDEVALVQGASDAGVVFQRRARMEQSSASHLTIKIGANTIKEFEVLQELEFNSDRKRMSVIARCEDEIWCITKGADSVMQDLLQEPMEADAQEAINRFSKHGLRTLVVGMKMISKEEFSLWLVEMSAAANIVDSSRQSKVDEVAARMENQLTFVGITAVEDRLQDGVPGCIETIKAAGIRMWVLTGDKIETAVDIARSCALFGEQSTLAYAVGANSLAEATSALVKAKAELKHCDDGGLVLDGKTLWFALEDEAAKTIVYELGLASRSCICCRLTPLQKRRLVELVREKSPATITLAIGDGANDVPMIEGAHLGVGMRGKEGAQAVQVSDIAISQFRFLTPLLLCHGRRAYQRVSFYLCYYFYKNVALAAADMVWACQNEFSGRIAFPEYLSAAYNVFFTSYNAVIVLGLDQDVPDAVANANPQLYLVGPQRALFNRFIFSSWMVYAFWHGGVAWLVPNLWFGGDDWTEDRPGIFWVSSLTAFTSIVVIVNLRLVLHAQNPTAVSCWLPTLTAIVLFCGYAALLGHTGAGKRTQENFAEIPRDTLEEARARGAFGLSIVIAMCVDVVEKVVRYLFSPTELMMVQKCLGKTTQAPP